MKLYTVDRFEGDKVVLLLRDDETVQLDIDRSKLPEEIREGDILNILFSESNEPLEVEISREETDKVKERIKALQRKLINKTNNEDR